MQVLQFIVVSLSINAAFVLPLMRILGLMLQNQEQPGRSAASQHSKGMKCRCCQCNFCLHLWGWLCSLNHGSDLNGVGAVVLRTLLGIFFVLTLGWAMLVRQVVVCFQRATVQLTGEAVWWLIRSSVGRATTGHAEFNTPQDMLQGMLQINVMQQYITILNTIIVVSGLLTTSTYSCIMQTFKRALAAQALMERLQSTRLTPANMEFFRLLNVVSFLASVTAIICCTLLILWLNKYAPKDDEAARNPPQLLTWAAALLWIVHVMGMAAFFMSFVLSVLAALVAALGFFTHTWASLVAVACVVVTVGIILLGSAMCGITQTSHWGLDFIDTEQQDGAEAGKCWGKGDATAAAGAAGAAAAQVTALDTKPGPGFGGKAAAAFSKN
jgi:hypothetical protein